MEKAVNQVLAAKVTEQCFDVDKLQPRRTRVMELTRNGFRTYYMEDKNRKKLGVGDTLVSKKEMDKFFLKQYDFVRNIETRKVTIDGCPNKVTFIYSRYTRKF